MTIVSFKINIFLNCHSKGEENNVCTLEIGLANEDNENQEKTEVSNSNNNENYQEGTENGNKQ